MKTTVGEIRWGFESLAQRMGSWCNGNISVSKTEDRGSIPLGPVKEEQNMSKKTGSNNFNIGTPSTQAEKLAFH